ncbi:MAG: ATP-dependent DNA ligase [Candidatus Njordarchaeales archaeon]
MPMMFETLCDYYDRLEKLSGKIEMTKVLVDLFTKADPEEIDKIVYLTIGELWPDYLGRPELGVAERLLLRAVSKATGVSVERLEKMLKALGDIGKVAERAIRMKKTQALLVTPLTVKEVYEKLVKIAHATGEGSQDLKLRILVGLLVSAKPIEARYLARIVIGQLRLGVGEMLILDALAEAFLRVKNGREIIERAYNKVPDLGYIAKVAAQQGVEGLSRIRIEPGRPIRPMLAERLSDPGEILRKLGGEAAAEWKYDGERCQIHKRGDDVWLFSRRLENITAQYPDVVDYVRKYIKANECIIEGEIVAIDPETGEMRPFQELMRRKRKYDIHKIMEEIPVKVFLFDLIYLEGEEYLDKPYLERRRKLEEILEPNEYLTLSHMKIVKNVEELEKFFLEAIEAGCEGLVLKSLRGDSIYQAGARGWLWIKYKRDYKSEMADTVDLVVIGAFAGKGRRAGSYGALLVAAYNPERDIFESVCKVGSGFTDTELDNLPTLLQPYMRERKPPNVDSVMEPDYWVEPSLVMEVIGAELTLSPVHTAAKDLVKKNLKKDAGIAIRFPRFIRWRPDKSPKDATTTQELFEMYLAQLKKLEK